MTKQDGNLILDKREKLACRIMGHFLKSPKDKESWSVPRCLRNRIVMHIAEAIRPGVIGMIWLIVDHEYPDEDLNNINEYCESLARNLE